MATVFQELVRYRVCRMVTTEAYTPESTFTGFAQVFKGLMLREDVLRDFNVVTEAHPTVNSQGSELGLDLTVIRFFIEVDVPEDTRLFKEDKPTPRSKPVAMKETQEVCGFMSP